MTHHRSRARSPVTRYTYTHMRVKIFRHGIGGSAAILRVSVGVARHSVEGFYYGEGDRGRSSKVIHHFLPCRSLIRSFVDHFDRFSNNRQTWRWSRQPDSSVLRDSRDFWRLKEIVFRGCSILDVLVPGSCETRWSWNGLSLSWKRIPFSIYFF